MKQKKLDKQIMKSITFEGEEGFFISKKEKKELEHFILTSEEAIHNANYIKC